jgi:hypothetical protein
MPQSTALRRPRTRAGGTLILSLAGVAVLALPAAARADCALEIELLGQDLGRMKLTQHQGQQLAPFVDEALRYCRTGHDGLALESIEKARRVVALPKRDPLDEEPEPALQDAATMRR